MSDFDLCKETLVGKRIIFLGSSVTYGACAMGQSFIEALEEKDGIIAIKEAVSGTLLVDEDVGVYPSTSLLSRTLDVSVKHLLLVQVGESFKHLVHEALHFLHREEHFLLQQLEEIVLRLPMKDNSRHPCKDMNSITMYNSG